MAVPQTAAAYQTLSAAITPAGTRTKVIANVNALLALIPNPSAVTGARAPSADFDEINPGTANLLRAEILRLRAIVEI